MELSSTNKTENFCSKTIHPIQCSYCGKVYKKERSLVIHERRHIWQKPYRCEICDQMYTTSERLSKHQLEHKQDEIKATQDVEAKSCADGKDLNKNRLKHKQNEVTATRDGEAKHADGKDLNKHRLEHKQNEVTVTRDDEAKRADGKDSNNLKLVKGKDIMLSQTVAQKAEVECCSADSDSTNMISVSQDLTSKGPKNNLLRGLRPEIGRKQSNVSKEFTGEICINNENNINEIMSAQNEADVSNEEVGDSENDGIGHCDLVTLKEKFRKIGHIIPKIKISKNVGLHQTSKSNPHGENESFIEDMNIDSENIDCGDVVKCGETEISSIVSGLNLESGSKKCLINIGEQESLIDQMGIMGCHEVTVNSGIESYQSGGHIKTQNAKCNQLRNFRSNHREISTEENLTENNISACELNCDNVSLEIGSINQMNENDSTEFCDNKNSYDTNVDKNNVSLVVSTNHIHRNESLEKRTNHIHRNESSEKRTNRIHRNESSEKRTNRIHRNESSEKKNIQISLDFQTNQISPNVPTNQNHGNIFETVSLSPAERDALYEHEKFFQDHYDCEICGKSFKFRHHLKGHMRTHSDHKFYTCKFCKNTFFLAVSFKNHLLICQKRNEVKFKGEKDKELQNKRSCVINEVSLEEKVKNGEKHRCVKCDRKFVKWGNFLKHAIECKSVAKKLKFRNLKCDENGKTMSAGQKTEQNRKTQGMLFGLKKEESRKTKGMSVSQKMEQNKKTQGMLVGLKKEENRKTKGMLIGLKQEESRKIEGMLIGLKKGESRKTEGMLIGLKKGESRKNEGMLIGLKKGESRKTEGMLIGLKMEESRKTKRKPFRQKREECLNCGKTFRRFGNFQKHVNLCNVKRSKVSLAASNILGDVSADKMSDAETGTADGGKDKIFSQNKKSERKVRKNEMFKKRNKKQDSEMDGEAGDNFDNGGQFLTIDGNGRIGKVSEAFEKSEPYLNPPDTGKGLASSQDKIHECFVSLSPWEKRRFRSTCGENKTREGQLKSSCNDKNGENKTKSSTFDLLDDINYRLADGSDEQQNKKIIDSVSGMYGTRRPIMAVANETDKGNNDGADKLIMPGLIMTDKGNNLCTSKQILPGPIMTDKGNNHGINRSILPSPIVTDRGDKYLSDCVTDNTEHNQNQTPKILSKSKIKKVHCHGNKIEMIFSKENRSNSPEEKDNTSQEVVCDHDDGISNENWGKIMENDHQIEKENPIMNENVNEHNEPIVKENTNEEECNGPIRKGNTNHGEEYNELIPKENTNHGEKCNLPIGKENTYDGDCNKPIQKENTNHGEECNLPIGKENTYDGDCNEPIQKENTNDGDLDCNEPIRYQKTYECLQCNKSFEHPFSLQLHQNEHLNKRIFCKECPKSFVLQWRYVNHVKWHTDQAKKKTNNNKPFKINYKWKIFQKMPGYELSKSRDLMSKSDHLKCDLCGLSFSRRYSLHLHKMKHSGFLPYKCHLCGNRYLRNCHLTRHRMSKHRGKTKKINTKPNKMNSPEISSKTLVTVDKDRTMDGTSVNLNVTSPENHNFLQNSKEIHGIVENQTRSNLKIEKSQLLRHKSLRSRKKFVTSGHKIQKKITKNSEKSPSIEGRKRDKNFLKLKFNTNTKRENLKKSHSDSKTGSREMGRGQEGSNMSENIEKTLMSEKMKRQNDIVKKFRNHNPSSLDTVTTVHNHHPSSSDTVTTVHNHHPGGSDTVTAIKPCSVKVRRRQSIDNRINQKINPHDSEVEIAKERHHNNPCDSEAEITKWRPPNNPCDSEAEITKRRQTNNPHDSEAEISKGRQPNNPCDSEAEITKGTQPNNYLSQEKAINSSISNEMFINDCKEKDLKARSCKDEIIWKRERSRKRNKMIRNIGSPQKRWQIMHSKQNEVVAGSDLQNDVSDDEEMPELISSVIFTQNEHELQVQDQCALQGQGSDKQQNYSGIFGHGQDNGCRKMSLCEKTQHFENISTNTSSDSLIVTHIALEDNFSTEKSGDTENVEISKDPPNIMEIDYHKRRYYNISRAGLVIKYRAKAFATAKKKLMDANRLDQDTTKNLDSGYPGIVDTVEENGGFHFIGSIKEIGKRHDLDMDYTDDADTVKHFDEGHVISNNSEDNTTKNFPVDDVDECCMDENADVTANIIYGDIAEKFADDQIVKFETGSTCKLPDISLHNLNMASVLLDRIDVDNTGCYVTERGDRMTAEDQAGSKQVTIINFTYTPGHHDTKSSNHIEEQQMRELPKQKQVGSKEEYTCLECGKIYRFSHQLKTHMRFHNKGSQHRCQVCGKFFLRNILLKYHMKKKHPQELLVTANIAMAKSGDRKVEKPSIIEGDGKTNNMEDRGMEEQCTEKISINHRGNVKCSGNEGGIKDKWCKYCQKESDASHVKQHDYIQKNKRVHKCDRCLKVFTKRSILNRHKKSHLKNKGWSRSRSRSKQFGGHLEKQLKTKQNHALMKHPDEHDGFFEKDTIPEIAIVPKNNDNIKISEPEKSKLVNKYGMRSRSRSCIEGQAAVDSEPRSQNNSDMLGLIEVENGDNTLKTYRCTRCSKDFKKCGNLINHVSMHLKEMMLKRRKKRVETSELGHSNQVTISISPMKNSVTINSESSMAQNKIGDIHAVYEKDSNSVERERGDNWMESVNSVGTDPSVRLINSRNVSKFPQKNKTGTTFLNPKWSKMNPEKGFGKTNKNRQKWGKTTKNEKSEVSLKASCVKGKTSFLERNYTSDNTRISESIKRKAGGFEGKGADRPNINLAGVKSQQSVTTKLFAKYSKQKQKRRHSALRTDKQDLKSDNNSDKNLTIKSRSTCHLCGHVFAQPWYLKTHIMTHTGEKPHTCDQCKRTFLHLNSLKRHKLFVHRK